MQRRLEDLDCFRGIHAVFVMICHAHAIENVNKIYFIMSEYIFIAIFFALRGFALTHRYLLKINSFFVSRIFIKYNLINVICQRVGKCESSIVRQKRN